MRGFYVSLAVRIVVLWFVVAFVLVMLGGCSPRVAAAEPDDTRLPWCVRVTAKSADGPRLIETCVLEYQVCQYLRELAQERGSLVGLTSVGRCR